MVAIAPVSIGSDKVEVKLPPSAYPHLFTQMLSRLLQQQIL